MYQTQMTFSGGTKQETEVVPSSPVQSQQSFHFGKKKKNQERVVMFDASFDKKVGL